MNNYDYIIQAFTRDGNNTNLEVNNLDVGCITSLNNNFELDSNGNLTVNTITANNITAQAVANARLISASRLASYAFSASFV